MLLLTKRREELLTVLPPHNIEAVCIILPDIVLCNPVDVVRFWTQEVAGLPTRERTFVEQEYAQREMWVTLLCLVCAKHRRA